MGSRKRAFFGATLLAVLLSGCTSPPPEVGGGSSTVDETSPSEIEGSSPVDETSPSEIEGDSSTVDETAPREIGGAYDTIDELRDAFVAAGGSCPSWEQTNEVVAALQSGNCSRTTVLSLYGSTDAASSAALALKNLLLGYELEINLLLGPNWIVNSPEVELIHSEMGGTLLK